MRAKSTATSFFPFASANDSVGVIASVPKRGLMHAGVFALDSAMFSLASSCFLIAFKKEIVQRNHVNVHFFKGVFPVKNHDLRYIPKDYVSVIIALFISNSYHSQRTAGKK